MVVLFCFHFCGNFSRFVLNISQKLTSTKKESNINLEKSIHKLILFCWYLLQPLQDCKKIYWGTKWVPDELVVGVHQPFVRHLVGVSISAMLRSIYNMGV